MATERYSDITTSDFIDIIQPGRGRASMTGVPREVSLAIYTKQSKADHGARPCHPSLGILIAGKTLDFLRWRAGDRIKLQRSAAYPTLLMIRRSQDGGGASLCLNDKKRPNGGLKASITTTAFGVSSAPFVGLTPAEIIRVEKDSILIEIPQPVLPAFAVGPVTKKQPTLLAV